MCALVADNGAFTMSQAVTVFAFHGAAHISQLEKLKTKIIKAKKRTNNYLADYIVITPTVFRHLPKALQQMDCIMTIENIESKINELVI